MSLASNPSFSFASLFEECMYQLEVNNQEREAVRKFARLLAGVLGKASYLLRDVEVKYFVDEVMGFFLGKVFVTLCSADCVRCLWALVSAYSAVHPISGNEGVVQEGCCSDKTTGSCSTATKGCCSSSLPTATNSSCCKSPSTSQSIPSSISSH